MDGHVPGVLPLAWRNLHPEVLSHLPLGGFRDYLPGDLPGLGAEEQLVTLFSVLSHHPHYALPTTMRGAAEHLGHNGGHDRCSFFPFRA